MEKKLFPAPEVVAGTWDYFPKIKELCELRFGAGYVDEADYAQWMEHPDLIQVVLVEGDFAGVAVLRPASAEVIAQKMGMTEAEVLDITGGKPAVIYKSIALKPKYEKQGVGRYVVLDGLRRSVDMTFSAVFIAAWMYDGFIPAQKMLHSLGFTQLYQRKMLWYADEKYRCVACGGRCVCDGMIYYKKLGD